ncbi:unnamed protein product [Dicrocoelium dendriticum]|nr:unnamed protein product [Dicrocoelium dendriticum]
MIKKLCVLCASTPCIPQPVFHCFCTKSTLLVYCRPQSLQAFGFKSGTLMTQSKKTSRYVSYWTTEDVVKWMHKYAGVEGEKYASVFEQNGINGKLTFLHTSFRALFTYHDGRVGSTNWRVGSD